MANRDWRHTDRLPRNAMNRRNWDGPGVPGAGDNLIVRHGVAELTDVSLSRSMFHLASYNQAAPATLVLNNAAAVISTAGIAEDGVQGAIGARYSDITANGYSVVYLTTGGTRYGSSNINLEIPGTSNAMVQASLAGNTDLNIVGTGTLTNLGTTMYATETDVIPAVVGTGAWSLAGNAKLEFHSVVGYGQTVNMRGANSSLHLHDADTFQGNVTTENWFGQIILDGIDGGADWASYEADMLSLTRGNEVAANIRMDANSDFEVFGKSDGNAVLMAGLHNAPEPGWTTLLSHTA